MADFDHLPIINDPNPQAKGQRADAAANRQKLLETAEALFAREGVDNVNMERIAKRAGVGQATLYRNFPSKGDLCLTLLDDAFGVFQNEMLQLMRDGVAAGSSRLALLTLFLGHHTEFQRQHMALSYEIQREGINALQSPEPYPWLHATVQGLLAAASAAGELRQGLDESCVADLLLAPMCAQFLQLMVGQRGYDTERIHASISLLIAGLSAG